MNENTPIQIFEGIDLSFVYMDYDERQDFFQTDHELIELNHCFKGRFDIAYGDKKVHYVKQGDFHIGIYDKSTSYVHKARDYMGVTILIDVEKAHESLKNKYDEFGIDLLHLRERLFKENETYIVRSNPEMEHIFYELYYVPEEIKHRYYKLKVLEILLFLTGFSLEEEVIETSYYIKDDIRRIKQIHALITKHLDKHYTIAYLAEAYGLSESRLKSCFKEVYGQSVYAYTKHFKMDKAMYFLSHTDSNIDTIAYKLGYANPSKFSAAFKSVFNMTPSQMKRKLNGV